MHESGPTAAHSRGRPDLLAGTCAVSLIALGLSVGAEITGELSLRELRLLGLARLVAGVAGLLAMVAILVMRRGKGRPSGDRRVRVAALFGLFALSAVFCLAAVAGVRALA